jgi:hypothetical protein
MNFSAADLAPERQLNEAIWKSVKGTDSTMPGPRQAMPESENLGGN